MGLAARLAAVLCHKLQQVTLKGFGLLEVE